MDAAFSSIVFYEPTAAEADLALVAARLPDALWTTLPALLSQVPDPDAALNYLERYLRDASRPYLEFLERNPAALHYLLVVFSYSRFLSETLLQQPEIITWLHGRPGSGGLERIKAPEDLREEFARFSASAFDLAPAVLLARFKRREYLRIMLRDVLGLATLAETTRELSQLADVLLDRALRFAEQKLEPLFGTAQFTDDAGRVAGAGLTVLSLGKLGGLELNYASDIDLMFLYGRDGETSGGSSETISNAEYFARLAQAVLKLISESTAEGAVFRVDLRLRPEGQLGELVLPLASALDYYRTRAREWELQMLIKARVSAGDADTGRIFLREVQPLIYRRETNFAAVEAVRKAREEMTRGLNQGGGAREAYSAAWNVKLTPGGIRDIEFLAQCLQRVYGGADHWLSAAGAGSTLVALQRLHDKSYLSGRDFFRLSSAYQFLRKVEHRLQLRDGLQRHTLPHDLRAMDKLARRCGIEVGGERTAGEQLLQRVAQHFSEVREIYGRVIASRGEDAAQGETEVALASDTLAGFPPLRRLQEEYPAGAKAVAAAVETMEGAGRRGLQQFIESALLQPGLMGEIESHPQWIAQAAEICSRSDLLAEALARTPGEIRQLDDGAASAGAAEAPRSAEGVDTEESFDEAMARLRVWHRSAELGVLVRALIGRVPPFETFDALSNLAQQALDQTARLVFYYEMHTHERRGHERRSQERRNQESGDEMGQERRGAGGATGRAGPKAGIETAPFAVIALGRLGTREMDAGSDVDLIFVVDPAASAESMQRWRRLAERLVHVVSSHTREGMLFPVDTRLRPRGGEGEIVQSSTYVRDYFRNEAEAWEAAAFLKARAITGNQALAAWTIQQVQAALAERFADGGAARGSSGKTRALAESLAATRERLEREKTGSAAKGGFKTASGGYYDIEYIIAFLMLSRGLHGDSPNGPGHVLRQIASLEAAGVLASRDAQTLRSAALLYRALDHALRLVTGRPSGDLPEPAQEPRIARLLQDWGVPMAGGMQQAVQNARESVGLLYQQIVRAACQDAAVRDSP